MCSLAMKLTHITYQILHTEVCTKYLAQVLCQSKVQMLLGLKEQRTFSGVQFHMLPRAMESVCHGELKLKD